MSTPFLGEIKMVSYPFAMRGWAMCNGQILAISQNQALFALLGTTYGGDGRTTYGLPDLRGRSATHFGSGFSLGQVAGEEQHSLSIGEMPTHFHTANVSTLGGQHSPSGATLPGANAVSLYDGSANINNAMAPGFIGNAGSGLPHENRMPFLTVNLIIALQGLFPSRS